MNILAIGAHFDDVEIGCSGTIAKHVESGDRVITLVVTHSKYSNHDGILMRDRNIAFSEGDKASKLLGYELLCLNYETKQVGFDFKLIEDINRIIDEYSVDTIYTHWDGDVHQDHQAVGRASLCAGRKVNNLYMYQSNLYMSTKHFHANYFVDISDFMDKKIASIKTHETEVHKFGEEWVDFWVNEAINNGKKFGVRSAEAFMLVKCLR